MENQAAIHNLRNPPDISLGGTPVVQRLGLRNAIRLVDQITQVLDMLWVVYLHQEVAAGSYPTHWINTCGTY